MRHFIQTILNGMPVVETDANGKPIPWRRKKPDNSWVIPVVGSLIFFMFIMTLKKIGAI